MTLIKQISILANLIIITVYSIANTSFVASVQTMTKSSQKLHLVVATLESPPFIMKRTTNDNNTIEWYGYCMDFFLELIKHLPYEVTYEIYQVADNKFGSKVRQIIMEPKDNSKFPVPRKIEKWNGLIGDLEMGKAHIGLAPLAVMAERELAIDFTVPFYDLVGIQILLKKPEVPQDWFKFLTVLDNEVWFSITVAYFVTSFVIFLFDRLSPYSHKNLTRLRRIAEARRTELKLGSSSLNKRNPLGGIQTISNDLTVGFTQGAGYLTNMASPRPGIARSRELAPELETQSLRLFGNLSFMTNKSGNKVAPDHGGGFNKSQTPPATSRVRRLSANYWDTLKSRNSSLGAWTNEDDESDDSGDSGLDDGRPDFGMRDSLWFCITSLTPQGGGEAPQNLSGRVVAGAWWLFCFIVIASYTANLAAFLTVSRLDIPIESLDDLAKQYRIKYAPIDGTAEQTYFERMAYIEEIFYNIWKEMSMNDSLSEEERSKFAVWDYPINDKYTKIWAQIQEVGMPPDIDSAIRRVKNSNLDDGFALLADANLVKHAIMTDCSLKAVGDELSRKPIALGIQKGNERLRDDVSYAILQLINRRFMEVLREKWWTNNPMRITCDNNDESEGISIENIGGVFIIILAGVTLSFFVWAIERFAYKTRVSVSKELIETQSIGRRLNLEALSTS